LHTQERRARRRLPARCLATERLARETARLIARAAFVVVAVIVSLMKLIWSVNTPFHASIAIGLRTWLAVMCLSSPFISSVPDRTVAD